MRLVLGLILLNPDNLCIRWDLEMCIRMSQKCTHGDGMLKGAKCAVDLFPASDFHNPA